MVAVTNADRVVFPTAGHTKGDVVRYYERIAPRLLPHVSGRPLTMRRFPRGIGQPGFFQKNVPPHYPASIARIELPRREGVTVHPILSEAEHLAYVANQGAIELHVPCSAARDLFHPDRLVIDLDPPEGAVDLARRAAKLVRDALYGFGLETVPVATGSKGYHVVAALRPSAGFDEVTGAVQEFAAILADRHPEELTTTFRVAKRGGRVFLDWLRNVPNATVVAPFSLRARARASVAVPLTWSELDATAPDAFTLADVDALAARSDPLIALAERAPTADAFVRAVNDAFRERGLEIERFDRFRS